MIMRTLIFHIVAICMIASMLSFTLRPPAMTETVVQHIAWDGQSTIRIDLDDEVNIVRSISPTVRLETYVIQRTGSELSLEYSIREGHFEVDLVDISSSVLRLVSPDIKHYVFVNGQLQETDFIRTLYVPYYIDIIRE